MEPDLRSNLIDQRISPYLREAHEGLLDAANLKAGSRTLVLECRDGWAAEEAWRRVRRGRVDGVDGSPAMIELANRYRAVPDGLEFGTWDHRTLPFADVTFDSAIVTFSLHRYERPGDVLGEVFRVLAPGGRALVLEPVKYGFGGLYVVVDWLYRIRDPGHRRYYSRRQLVRLLAGAGFVPGSPETRFERLRVGGKLLANAILLVGAKPAATGEGARTRAPAS